MFAEPARAAIDRCRALAAYSEEPGFTTRTFLSPPMHAVHDELRAWMTYAGMAVRLDAAGNLRGTYPAAAAGAPRLLIGSHLDTVPHAGAFDGVLGVVIGITLVELLAGRRLPYAIEVIGFSEEEGVRFGVPFIGSRALAGTIDDELLERRDASGLRVSDAIREFGLDPSLIAQARVEDGTLGYLELHIEQGPVLERLGLPLGIVDVIAGQSRADVVFTGAAGHAGTTPMEARRDAVACAAEWIAQVETTARETTGLVATVGRVAAVPGAANVIAGQCGASLDVRHVHDGARGLAFEHLRRSACEIASRRGLIVGWDPRLERAAVPMDASFTRALTHAVERSGVPAHVLSSGAGHDAMVLAERMPVAMLLLRTPRGISHDPEEDVEDEVVAAALAAGMAFLDELASAPRG